MDGAVTPADHARLLTTLKDFGSSPTAASLLHLARATNLPSAGERRELADTLAAFHEPQRLHYALVTSSVLLRGVLRAVNWLTDSKMQQQVFATPNDALSWLAPHIDVHPDDVRADMHRAFPGFHDLRW